MITNKEMKPVDEFRRFKEYIKLDTSVTGIYEFNDSVSYRIHAEDDKFFQFGIISKNILSIYPDIVRDISITIDKSNDHMKVSMYTGLGQTMYMFNSSDYSIVFIPKDENILQIVLLNNSCHIMSISEL